MDNGKSFLQYCILALSISLFSVFFYSCGNSETDAYQEIEISIPEEINQLWDFQVCEDGRMQIAAISNNSQKGFIWESCDAGKNWNKLYCYTDLINLKDCAQYDCPIYLTEDCGSVCMIVDNSMNENNTEETRCYYIASSEDVKEIQNVMPESKVSEMLYVGNDFSWDAAVICQGNILVSNQSGETYLINKNTNEISAIVMDSKNPLFGADMFMIDEDSAYLIGVGDVIEYDLKKKEIIQKNDKNLIKVKEIAVNSEKTTIMAANKKSFYIFNEKGLKKISEGKQTKLINNSDMSFVPSEVYGRKICVDREDNIYLAINQENDAPKVLCYKKDNRSSEKTKKTLKIYSLRDDEGVQKLADYYQKKNKDIKVEVIVGLQESDSKNLDDAIKKLNTSMLGGDGPDIVFLDGLNVDTYIKNNMLLRLDSEIEELNQKNNFTQMIQSFSQGKEVYAVPTRFGLPIVLSQYEELVGAKDGADFLKCVEKQKIAVDEYNFSNDVRFYYQVFLGNDVDNGTVKKDEICNFLQSIKMLYNAMPTHEMINLKYLTLPPQQTGGSINYLLGSDNLEVDYILNGDDLQILQLDNTEYGIASNEKGFCYMPRLIAGINAATKQKNESKAFVSYLLSEEGQAITGETMGLPVNKIYLKNMLSSLSYDQAEIGNDVTSKVLQLKSLSESEIDNFTNKVYSVNSQTNNNCIVMKIFMEYTEKYLNGELTEEETIKEISRRLELYSNE